MKKFILNSKLLFHASRLNRKDAYSVLLSNQYKTLETSNKSSKIDVRYEQESSKINIYIKPRCYINNFIYDKSFVYVGLLDTDWTITEDDYPYLEEVCRGHNIIPLFDKETVLSKMIQDILNGETFSYTYSSLNHSDIYNEYVTFNKKVLDKLKSIADFNKDLFWVQDFNFLNLLPHFTNSILNIDKYNELFKCVPFYKNLCENIKTAKIIINNGNNLDIDNDNIINISDWGIDKPFIDTVLPKNITFNKNTIVIPYDSIHHMICLDKYINKYDVPIKIYLLNINIEKKITQEILNYITCLQMKTEVEIINPETDSEFYNIISRAQIGFYKMINDTFLYFNRHIIENSVYDYEKVADEIYKKLHYIEKINKTVKDINDIKTEILEILNKKSVVEEIMTNNKNETLNIYEENILKNDKSTINHEIKNDSCNIKNDLEIVQNETSRMVENLHISKNENILKDPRLENLKYIILDYDGTLVPLRDDPSTCFLPEDLSTLLINLNKYIKIIICSGRSKEDMDKFIPKEIEVYAEHVSYVRKMGKWNCLSSPLNFDLEYKIAKFYLDRTPGSELERKSNGFVFHYRNCEDFIKNQGAKLYADLIKISENIKLGKDIVEYKTTSKIDIFKFYNKNLLICGDDVTDEDMFDKNKGLTVKVGECEKTKAEYKVRDVSAMVEILKKIYDRVEN